MDENIYNDMLRKGLISVTDSIVARLVHSEPIVFDALDRVLGTEDDWSEFVVWEN